MPAQFYQGAPHWLVWAVVALLLAVVAWLYVAMKVWANGLRFDAPPYAGTYDPYGYGTPAWVDAARAALSISRRRDMQALVEEVGLDRERVPA